jgi:hypothetical protein
MNYSELILLRDKTIKNSILRTLPPEQRPHFESIVDRAFRDGAQFWSRQQIVTLFGTERAKCILGRSVDEDLADASG